MHTVFPSGRGAAVSSALKVQVRYWVLQGLAALAMPASQSMHRRVIYTARYAEQGLTHQPLRLRPHRAALPTSSHGNQTFVIIASSLNS